MIPLIDRNNAPLLARPYLEVDQPNPLAAVMTHVPELLEVAMPFIGAVYGPTALPGRFKEIVVLRTSVLNQCRFCTRVHTTLAANAGLTPDEIAFLHGTGPSPSTLDECQLAAFPFADALCNRPSDAVSTVKPFFRNDQIVELAMLAGMTIFLNRFCMAIGLS